MAVRNDQALETADNAAELLHHLRNTLLQWGSQGKNLEKFLNASLAAQAFLFAETLFTIRHDAGEFTMGEIRKEWETLVTQYMEEMIKGKHEFVPFNADEEANVTLKVQYGDVQSEG